MVHNILTRSISITPRLRARLIKFRYGKQAASAQHSSVVSDKPGAKRSPAGAAAEPIWDFQIPQRWRRKQLTEEEIAVINNGGPV